MKVRVTKQDIDKALEIKESRKFTSIVFICPIAQALKRRFNLDWDYVAVDGVNARINNQLYQLDADAIILARDFDLGNLVEPTTINLFKIRRNS